MGSSAIEWTDETWNPVTGCTKVSTGCKHCYAETITKRFPAAFPNGFAVTLHPERLEAPLHWRKPRRVFVNSMSDLFHGDIPVRFIKSVWDVIVATPQHTYQILTKRADRMSVSLGPLGIDFYATTGPVLCPQSNVWLGTSVENQATADERIPHLLQTPAAVRFLSCEPLLGPIDFSEGPLDPMSTMGNWSMLDDIHWVIVGAESGPKARPMDLAWARSIVVQCKAAAVPVFVKQLCKNGRKIKYEDWPADLQIREWPEVPR